MSWTSFLLGFLAFPLLAGLFVVFVTIRGRPRPVDVATRDALQGEIREFLATNKNRATLFIWWPTAGLQVRVFKHVRKTLPDTLSVELRNSDKSRPWYEASRAALAAESIEFVETLTPATRRPRRLRIRWPDGGPLVVSAACHAIEILSAPLPDHVAARRLATREDPILISARRAAAV